MKKSYSRQVFAVAWVSTLLSLTAGLQAGSYQVGVAPSTVKIMIQGAAQTPPWPLECTISDHYDLYLARGEHEAMQVVVIATTALTNAHVTVSVPQEIHGAGPLNGEANAWLVGHVDVCNTGYVDYPEYLAGYHGWFPDPLLTFTNTCNINVGDRVAFWIDVATLRTATAGDYVATIAVAADNSPSTNVQLNIHVWDFELPLKASLPTAFSLGKTTADTTTPPDVGVGGGATYIYGTGYDTKGIDQKFYDMALNHRMGITHLYGGDVESFGNITDWAARGSSGFNLKYMAKTLNLPRVTDPVLNTLYTNVKNAGMLDMAYVYGFDEVGSSYFTALIQMFNKVHDTYPGLRTMTSAKDYTYDPSTDLWKAVDIWVPLIDVYNQTAANQLRSQGKDMWWYVCSGPKRPYANFFVEWPAIEPRLLMGLMAHKCQTGGFLYYQIAKWLKLYHQPGGWITSGPYTNWNPQCDVGNNGDGSLFCAGADGPLPTIRLENIRDGLEDYEYLKLLGNLVTTMSAISQPTARQVAWLSSVQQLLPVPTNLIDSVTSFNRDTVALESYRKQLATAILTGKVLTVGPLPNADHDGDLDVDMDDFGSFQTCLSNSLVNPVAPGCQWADLNVDTHVDGDDMTLFLGCASGPAIPANPHCAD